MTDRHHNIDNDHRNFRPKKNNDLDAFNDAVDLLYKICRGESPFVLEDVEQLLQTHPTAASQMIQCDPDDADKDYRSPLHFACMRKNAPFALIKAFVRVCPDSVRLSTPKKRRLPLHDACRYSTSLSMIQLLIEAWPDSDKQYDRGICRHKIPLHDALKNRTPSLNIIQFLVQQWPESIQINDTTFPDSYSIVHLACECGLSTSIIKFLVAQWPEAIRMESELYGLPLKAALKQRETSTATIEFLIASWPGCIKEIDYCTLCVAVDCQNKNADTIALLLNLWPVEAENNLFFVHQACSGKSSLPVLQLLLQTWPGAISIQDCDGDLPLH